jgi:hypothetical protein
MRLFQPVTFSPEDGVKEQTRPRRGHIMITPGASRGTGVSFLPSAPTGRDVTRVYSIDMALFEV